MAGKTYTVVGVIAHSAPEWRLEDGEKVTHAKLRELGQSDENIAALVKQGALEPKGS